MTVPNESSKIPIWIFSKSSDEEAQFTQQELKKYIEQEYGPAQRETFAFSAKSLAGEFTGGISGYVHWNWVYIGQLWVAENHRNQSVGKFLLQSLNKWLEDRKFTGIYVDTFSEKTAHFYMKNGFEKFGEIPNFPNESNTRFFLKKTSGPYLHL